MKTFGWLVALLVAVAVGLLAGRWFWPADVNVPAVSNDPQILYWVAPMDSNFRRDQPGKSPMGMDLVPVYASDAGETGQGVVSINSQMVNNLGVRTAPVVQGTLTRELEVPGYVQVNEETVIHIHTRVEGWIEVMTVKSEGERVSKGQTLFELYSPALVSAQEEYLAAVRSGNRMLIEASQGRLGSLGLNAGSVASLRKSGQATERVTIRAASDGIVAKLNVRPGMFVQPATIVMSIYSLDSVWLIAELFERDSAWLTTGSPATVHIDSMPQREWAGVIDYIYPDLDPVTRSLRARMTLDNPGELLRPNLYAKVSIQATVLSDVLHIPIAALIRGGHQDRVVIALGDGRFQSRQVTTGMETASRVQVRSGLSPGDVVVVSGQFLIDSESNIASDLARAQQDGATP